MDLYFIMLVTFCGVVVAVCIAGISNRVKKIQDLLDENRKASASLEGQLHQINGTLIEIAALLKGQRPTS